MAKSSHDEWIKYGLYALGAYLAYTKLWPIVSGEISSLTAHNSTPSSLPAATGASSLWGSVATEFGSGIPSSSLAVNPAPQPALPITAANPNAGLSRYFITATDKANMLSLMPNTNQNGLYTFEQWKAVYWQAKGYALPLLGVDVNLFSNDQLVNIDQFVTLVNTRVPSPTLSGLDRYGIEVNNGWVGVM